MFVILLGKSFIWFRKIFTPASGQSINLPSSFSIHHAECCSAGERKHHQEQELPLQLEVRGVEESNGTAQWLDKLVNCECWAWLGLECISQQGHNLVKKGWRKTYMNFYTWVLKQESEKPITNAAKATRYGFDGMMVVCSGPVSLRGDSDGKLRKIKV